MSGNKTEDASADSKHVELFFVVVDHNFMRTTNYLWLQITQGMGVNHFLEAALVKYPGIFDIATAGIYHVPGGIIPHSRTKKVESEGWVEIFPVQTFTQDTKALCADPKRWIKIPNDNKSIYYVIQTPGKVIQSDDEDSVWTAGKRLPLLYDTGAPVSAPSVLAKMAPSQLHTTNFGNYINYNCPRETESISLTLLSEVFSRFKDDCNLEPDSEMSQVLIKYTTAALGMAQELSQPVNEKTLTSTLFKKLYGFELVQRARPYETDGHLVKNGRMQMLGEFKSRTPSGDALVQGAQYYRNFYTDHLKPGDHLPEGDVLPAFLITSQGPLINVYGIALVEDGQVQSEYLTSVNAGCHWTNNGELRKFTQILYALRKALDRLDALPELPKAPTSPPRKRQKTKRPTQKVWPYPRTFTELGSKTNVEFQYLKQLDGERFLFVVQPVTGPSPKKLLVKFVQSYGRAVHEEVASAKYAPELHGFTELSGGWKMVVMEYLESPAWRDGSSLRQDDQVVQRGLLTVRNKILPLLKKKGYVHGDIRLANLMFGTDGVDDDSDPAVNLVDFDFAGEAGKTTYPWNLNTACRPRCQQPGAPLEFSHDDVSLKAVENSMQSLGKGAGLRH